MQEDFDTSDVEAPEPGPPMVPFPELTRRECEVVLRLAEGDKNRDVARLLKISIKTVDTHRGHALKKLQLRNNVDLCRLAIRRGYVAP